MADIRPIVTYQTDQVSPEQLVIDISIDTPFDGFFGDRILVPTPTASEDRDAKILEWVKRKVQQQVGKQTADLLTFQAV